MSDGRDPIAASASAASGGTVAALPVTPGTPVKPGPQVKPDSPVQPATLPGEARLPMEFSGGFLLLDKPVGVSSFQALRPLKRLFPKTKIGHAGTLDPAASGLLLVGIGVGTRLLEYLEGMTKTYRCEAIFGLASDSYDMEGEVRALDGDAAVAAENLNTETVAQALSPFRGRIRQTPPAYSAIKVNGVRAYALARAGESVALESREVEILSLEMTSFFPVRAGEPARAGLEMTCSKGTYVRSLVHDLGQALGCGAVTDKIRRLAIGTFRVEDAATPAPEAPWEALLPLDQAVRHLPRAVLTAEQVPIFLHGQAVPAKLEAIPDAASSATASTATGAEYRACDADGRLLAIATLNAQGWICPKKVLVRP